MQENPIQPPRQDGDVYRATVLVLKVLGGILAFMLLLYILVAVTAFMASHGAH